MNARSLLIIVAALLVAGVTAFLARGWLTAERAQIQTQQQVVPAPAPAEAVLVAAAALPTGSFIKEEHLRWQAWPADAADPNYFLKEQTDLAALIGSVVRRGIAAGEPIVSGKIVKPGARGFLAAVLEPGMRAVTFGISETSAVANLVFPGDRVDMLLTHALPGSEDEAGNERRASETVLENVRILAIGQRLDEQSQSPASGKTATIEVTPKQAEMVAVLTELGRVSLALRSLAKEELEEAASLVMSSAASPDDAARVSEPPASAEAGATAAEQAAGGAQANDAGATQAPVDDNPPAVRGLTYTLDSEVSRLLGPSDAAAPKVMVQRGSTLQEITFK